MLPAEVRYLRDCISDHLRWCFAAEAQSVLDSLPIRWCGVADASCPTEQALYIPLDVPTNVDVDDAWTVPFGSTQLTFWNRLPPPSPDWRLEDEAHPLWYRHPSGALLPTWNLAPTLFGLLTLREERERPARDDHGRFLTKESPRHAAGLLQVPIFNDSVAALVAAADGMRESGTPARRMRPELVLPPALVLSHDLDQLRGNDVWTQLVRLSRVLRPRLGSDSRLSNLWHLMANAVWPRRYFFDNVVGMLAIERMMGFTSTLYFLNGSGGRFGARGGSALIPETAALAAAGWPIGLHYNYDTFLDATRLRLQREELERLVGQSLNAGRAHYLRFDPAHSWRFLATQGIKVDETLGYPDAIGYRAGIAAPFRPYDAELGARLPLVELPLVAMEAELAAAGPEPAVITFTALLRHLGAVGGALSLLFHPGQFHNPEYPETRGLYRRLLGVARDVGARSVTASAWRA